MEVTFGSAFDFHYIGHLNWFHRLMATLTGVIRTLFHHHRVVPLGYVQEPSFPNHFLESTRGLNRLDFLTTLNAAFIPVLCSRTEVRALHFPWTSNVSSLFCSLFAGKLSPSVRRTRVPALVASPLLFLYFPEKRNEIRISRHLEKSKLVRKWDHCLRIYNGNV